MSEHSNKAHFLKTIAGINYIERLEAAPTKKLRDDFKNGGIPWPEYKKRLLEVDKREIYHRLFL